MPRLGRRNLGFRVGLVLRVSHPGWFHDEIHPSPDSFPPRSSGFYPLVSSRSDTRSPFPRSLTPSVLSRTLHTPARINTNRRLSCRYSSARRASPKSFRETAPAAGWLVPLQPPRFLTTTIIPWDAAIAATDNERATRKYAGSQLDVVLRVRIGLNPLPEGAP